MSATYEIRIGGRLSSPAAELFGDLDVVQHEDWAVVRGDLDQAGLLGVLERVRALGLELLDARRVRAAPRA